MSLSNNDIRQKLKKAIDLNNFNSDDSLQIVIADQPVDKNKLNHQKSASNILHYTRPQVLHRNNTILESFKKKISGRVTTKNVLPIDVDNNLAPSIHTRAKGDIRKYNQFIPKQYNLDKEEIQWKEGKYQFNKKPYKLQQQRYKRQQQPFNKRQQQRYKHQQQPKLKQSKLVYIRVDDDMKKYGRQQLYFPLPGESIYQARRKPIQLQKIQTVSGIEFSCINDSRFHQYQKSNQIRKKDRLQQKKKQKQQSQKQKQQRLKQIENTFSDLLGLDMGKQPQTKYYQSIDRKGDQDQGLRNLSILQEIQDDQLRFDSNPDNMYYVQQRPKYGLNQVKAYDSTNAFPFVKAILGYKFTPSLKLTQTKKIPNTFTDCQMYKKTFHYLVINQCIADMHQRMKKIEKEATIIDIQIVNIKKSQHGIAELQIKELLKKQIESQENDLNSQELKDRKPFLLKNYSMSKNRLGIITSHQRFKLENFGLFSHEKRPENMHFTFLCFLKSPDSKQQLKEDVKVQACIKQSDLEYILKMTKKKKAYFYDLEKLSTNIRQYMSVSNIQHSELADLIYKPIFIDNAQNLLISEQTRGAVDGVLQQLEAKYNKTQFQSIRQMVRRQNGIVLLQGPPGTGKTSTLLGLLAAQYAYLRRVKDNRKIMICAPSNAAINHIAKRLQQQGLINSYGQTIFPNVIRLGIVDSQDPDIIKCSLDHICQKKLLDQKSKTLNQSNMTTIQIRQTLMGLQKQIRNLNFQIQKARKNNNQHQLNTLYQVLKRKKAQNIRLQGLLYNFRRQKIVSKKLYQQLQKKLLKNAQIIITTLSSSGTQKVQQIMGQIACLIVDQAAQATQPSLLIALQTGVSKVMLIGDPYQLPATTLSPDSNVTLFNRSLFQRFIDSGIQPYFLNTQYRMTPMIREFPSNTFYKGRLVDGQFIRQRQMPGVLQGFGENRSVIFVDARNGKQMVQDSSFCNHKEAYIIGNILKKYKLLESNISIGIITPYQSQRKLLTKQILPFQAHKSKTKPQAQFQSQLSSKCNIMINTIDSFQGQQKDLIIISTVRSNNSKQIGFLVDQRRINVALTRAKYGLIIVGDGDTLSSNQIWNQLIKNIQHNKLCFQVNNYQDQHQVINCLNSPNYFNQKKIQRQYYHQHQLTFDPRKIKRNEIKQDDFKKNKKQKKNNNNNINLTKSPQNQKKSLQNQMKNPQISNERKISYDQVGQFLPSYDQEMDINSQFNKTFNQKDQKLPYFNYPYQKEQHNHQSEEIIKKKRKKEEETLLFQATCHRLKQVEKQKANDSFYKFLFS